MASNGRVFRGRGRISRGRKRSVCNQTLACFVPGAKIDVACETMSGAGFFARSWAAEPVVCFSILLGSVGMSGRRQSDVSQLC